MKQGEMLDRFARLECRADGTYLDSLERRASSLFDPPTPTPRP